MKTFSYLPTYWLVSISIVLTLVLTFVDWEFFNSIGNADVARVITVACVLFFAHFGVNRHYSEPNGNTPKPLYTKNSYVLAWGLGVLASIIVVVIR